MFVCFLVPRFHFPTSRKLKVWLEPTTQCQGLHGSFGKIKPKKLLTFTKKLDLINSSTFIPKYGFFSSHRVKKSERRRRFQNIISFQTF
jgi:hypothetical protein